MEELWDGKFFTVNDAGNGHTYRLPLRSIVGIEYSTSKYNVSKSGTTEATEEQTFLHAYIHTMSPSIGMLQVPSETAKEIERIIAEHERLN